MKTATDHQRRNPSLFPQTRWSLVLAAGSPDTEQGQKALGDLIVIYNQALITYVIKKFFYSEEDAKDVVQEFILHNVLKSNLINKVQVSRGHQFRRFLLCSLHSFTISEFRRKTALKRMPQNGFQALDHMDEKEALSRSALQSNDFDSAWARSVIYETLQRMEQECIASCRPDIWGIFQNRLRKPLLDGHPSLSYEELTVQYGLKSPAHAHNILVTGKRAFSRALDSVVGEYAVGKQAIAEEIQALQMILGSMK